MGGTSGKTRCHQWSCSTGLICSDMLATNLCVRILLPGFWEEAFTHFLLGVPVVLTMRHCIWEQRHGSLYYTTRHLGRCRMGGNAWRQRGNGGGLARLSLYLRAPQTNHSSSGQLMEQFVLPPIPASASGVAWTGKQRTFTKAILPVLGIILEGTMERGTRCWSARMNAQTNCGATL